MCKAVSRKKKKIGPYSSRRYEQELELRGISTVDCTTTYRPPEYDSLKRAIKAVSCDSHLSKSQQDAVQLKERALRLRRAFNKCARIDEQTFSHKFLLALLHNADEILETPSHEECVILDQRLDSPPLDPELTMPQPEDFLPNCFARFPVQPPVLARRCTQVIRNLLHFLSSQLKFKAGMDEAE